MIKMIGYIHDEATHDEAAELIGFTRDNNNQLDLVEYDNGVIKATIRKKVKTKTWNSGEQCHDTSTDWSCGSTTRLIRLADGSLAYDDA